jgi:tetratricopeptide (TPR) repeat protein
VRLRGFTLAVALALTPSGTGAQPYPALTPVPRTTSPAALHALANQREIETRIGLGFAAIEREDWHAASDEFVRVLSLEPHEPQASTAYYDLGIAQTGLGQLDDAVASFEAAIGRDPGFLAARSNLVSVELMRGDLPAARKAADALVALAPDSARALYARGLAALAAGDADTALADFRKLSLRNPSYAIAHYDLALAEIKLGRYADAERELRVALTLAPNYARAQLCLGTVLLHAGQREAARVAFDDAARNAQDVVLRTLAASLRDAVEH